MPSNSEDEVESPTVNVERNIKNLFRKHHPAGYPESVRRLLSRLLFMEEANKCFQFNSTTLRDENNSLANELKSQKRMVSEMKQYYQSEIDALEKKISDITKKEDRSRFQTLMSILQSIPGPVKSYEPPFSLPTTSIPVSRIDEETMTDEHLHLDCGEKGNSATENAVVRRLADPLEIAECRQLREESLRLKNDKHLLETQLKLLRNKLEQMNLQKLEKESLEHKFLNVCEINDRLIKENEQLKYELSLNLSGVSAAPSEISHNRLMVDRTLDLQIRLNEKILELDVRTKELADERKSHEETLAGLSSLLEEHKNLQEKYESSIKQNSKAVDDDVSKVFLKEIEDLKMRLSKYECSAFQSDTTRILHCRINPLDEAHEEFRELQSNRKRKQKCSFEESDLDMSLRKKMQEELTNEIADLKYQVLKLGREKSKAQKIQSDLIKKYRSIVLALSGLQIKMKDEDYVEVESVFDFGQGFTFKVEGYGKSVSLMDNEYVNKWIPQVHEYLEVRHSVPAFLAAVTLILVERVEATNSYPSFPSIDISD